MMRAGDEGFQRGWSWRDGAGLRKRRGWHEGRGKAEEVFYNSSFKSGRGRLFMFDIKILKIKLEIVKTPGKSLGRLVPACHMAFDFLFLVLLHSESQVPGLRSRVSCLAPSPPSGVPGTPCLRPGPVALLICIQPVYAM